MAWGSAGWGEAAWGSAPSAATGVVTGTLTANETGSDVAAISGDVYVTGTLTASETGADTAAILGDVIIVGSLSATETGSDTASIISGDPLHGFTQDQLDFLVAYMEANMTFPTAADITAAVYAGMIDGTTTFAESIRLHNSVLAGKVSGAGTGTEVFRDLADTKDRIVASVDGPGNRTAITRDAT